MTTSDDSDLTSRRSFVVTSATALLTLRGAPYIKVRRAPYDLVIRGGMVFDGTGAAGVLSDVGIAGGKITAIARTIADRGTEEIDARGLAVAPGFMDMHSHGDGSLDADPRAESLIRQGITTIIVGQDGSSRAPSMPKGRPAPADGATFTAMFAAYDKLSPAVNMASMVGLGGLRGIVVGEDNRPATPDEIARMRQMVEDALAQGACGASTGLEYTPGAFASLAELIAVSKPLSARRLPYATHMRNEDDQLLEAIDEAIAVARGAGCPLEISHLKCEGQRNWNKLDAVFARVADARKSGMDVTFDCYPYVAFSTGLTNLFPATSRDGGNAAFLERLSDPVTGPQLRAYTLDKVAMLGSWDSVMIVSVRAPEDKAAEGKRLGTYAKSLGKDPYDLTVEMLKRNNASISMVGFGMSEEDVARILASPLCSVCSDGGAFAIDGPTRKGSPHPRGLGTFPRIFAQYVRGRKTLTLEQAIYKMTGHTAARVRLADRGRLATGFAGDVTVFDPATIEDKATYEQPFQYPVGVHAVVVNGTVALRDGQRTPQGTGRALRPA
ncbi:MAG TPA: D-aminoacylase [Gemmatimonadaceae bacterium]|jgi:N-acyl-D-amino-acid deacylase